jgi:DNA-binding NarL/FixJ family response regulator
MTRVVVADDQAVVRSGLRMILEAHEGIDVVGEAATASRPSTWCGCSTPTSS